MMRSGLSTLIVIPAHNEEKSISDVVGDLLPLQLPILIVASACSDNTVGIVREIGCFVIEVEIGYETACIAGYRWALEKGYSRVMQLDADGQHPPEYVPILLNQSHRADWLIGSRQGTGTKINIQQRASSWILKQSVLSLFQFTLHDPTSGMWVLQKNALECLSQKPSSISMEAILRIYARRNQISILEVPVPMLERYSGTSMHDGFHGIINGVLAITVLMEYRFFLFKGEKNDYRVQTD
jgi:glycosyltransferase involved in cell wall biosynthesis